MHDYGDGRSPRAVWTTTATTPTRPHRQPPLPLRRSARSSRRAQFCAGRIRARLVFFESHNACVHHRLAIAPSSAAARLCCWSRVRVAVSRHCGMCGASFTTHEQSESPQHPLAVASVTALSLDVHATLHTFHVDFSAGSATAVDLLHRAQFPDGATGSGRRFSGHSVLLTVSHRLSASRSPAERESVCRRRARAAGDLRLRRGGACSATCRVVGAVDGCVTMRPLPACPAQRQPDHSGPAGVGCGAHRKPRNQPGAFAASSPLCASLRAVPAACVGCVVRLLLSSASLPVGLTPAAGRCTAGSGDDDRADG